MTTSFNGIFSLLSTIILLCHSIDQVYTLRCAHACAIGSVPLGTPDPIRTPCNTVEINTETTVCSVFLTINFKTSYIHGKLNEKSLESNKSPTLHVSYTMIEGATLANIDYDCKYTDDCDQDFVRETIGSSNWSQLNETDVRAKVTSMLFNPNASADNLVCANDRVCPSNTKCCAHLNQTDFNNNFPCDNTSTLAVVFDQYVSGSDEYRHTMMNVCCDKDRCNERNTIEQVHGILRNSFTLPLNYSAYIPKRNGSYRIDDSIGILTLLIFVCIKLNFNLP